MGQARLEALAEAAAQAGIEDPTFLAEPIAAGIAIRRRQYRPGDHVAVYDLGGGTFDTAVLRRTEDGFALVGPPGGDERLGGEDFDHRLADHLELRSLSPIPTPRSRWRPRRSACGEWPHRSC